MISDYRILFEGSICGIIKPKQIKLISLLLCFTMLILNSGAQSQETVQNVFRPNILKINLVPLPPLINNLNQKWIGIEYQRISNQKISYSALLDVGRFQDYNFTKYYDYFDEHQGFRFTREKVLITGFHLIPSLKYYVRSNRERKGQGIYVSVNIDYYHYFRKTAFFDSATNQTDEAQDQSARFNIGSTLGAQYLAFNRLAVEVNISIFTKLFTTSSAPTNPEIYPLNAFWRTANNASWATINIMIGYAFGSGKTTKRTR